MSLIHRLWESLRATEAESINFLRNYGCWAIINGPECSLKDLPGFWPLSRALSPPNRNPQWRPLKRQGYNNFPFDSLPLGLQREKWAARQRCCAVLLHQLEGLAHAHEAQVCAGDSSCEYDGARQPMSRSVYVSDAMPAGWSPLWLSCEPLWRAMVTQQSPWRRLSSWC